MTSARALGRAPLPGALARKYPSADRQWGWQYVFPASSHYTDRRTGVRHRHHLHETVVQKRMGEAVRLREDRQAGDASRLPPLLRDRVAALGLRHPYHPGASGPQRHQHHDDLHPRAEPRGPRRPKPRGRSVRGTVIRPAYADRGTAYAWNCLPSYSRNSVDAQRLDVPYCRQPVSG